MIDGVGKSGAGRIETARGERSAIAAPVGNAPVQSKGPVESAVFELVSSGPPIDSERVAAIRTAIAEGRYPVDPAKIAERMLELDLPRKGG